MCTEDVCTHSSKESIYVLSGEADYNRITAVFVLPGTTLMVPRNRSNYQTTGATGSLNGVPGSLNGVPGKKGWHAHSRKISNVRMSIPESYKPFLVAIDPGRGWIGTRMGKMVCSIEIR